MGPCGGSFSFFVPMLLLTLLILPLCYASIVLLPPNAQLPNNTTPPPSNWPQFLAYDLFQQPAISAPRGIYVAVQFAQDPTSCTLEYPPVTRPTLLLYNAFADGIAVCSTLVSLWLTSELF
jgi:hypothetical protein